MGKDMSLQPEVLASLFGMNRDPVLGIDNERKIVFANPAAAQLGAQAGMPAGDLLPEHILSDQARQFIATLRIGSRRANVSVLRLEDVTVCTYSFLSADPPSSGQVRALQAMASQLMTARLAMDALNNHIENSGDPVIQEASSALYKQYYLLRRSCLHLNQLMGILREDLPYQPRVTDLGNLCRELCDTVGELSGSLGISVVFNADFSLHLTMADRDLLEEMLANLLANSLLHCKQGDAIRVDLQRQGDRFILAVNDPGSGITPEQLASIFNDAPLDDKTDPAAGAGLGLTIARGIAERHGGTLILESRPGQGASVRVSLPIRPCESTTVNTPLARYRSDGMNIVLTELSPLLDKKYFNKRMFD